MEILYSIFVAPFIEMGAYPDLFIQALWDGFVSGTLYGLIALGFVLICIAIMINLSTHWLSKTEREGIW